MIDQLAVAAETRKIQHLLGVDGAEMEAFAAYPPDTLRALREAMSAALFDEHRRTFQRLEAASRLLPNALVAKMTTKFFGPVIAARVAGEMPAKRAIDVAQRLPVPFMADICLHLDPRSAPELVHGMPLAIIREIAKILVRRRDFVTMGRFVDSLSDEAIAAVLPDVEDDGALLQIAFFVEDRAHLDVLLGLMPDERLVGVIHAAYEQDLWSEALALMQHVGRDSRRRLGDLTAQQSDKLIADLVRTAQKRDLWRPVLEIIDEIPEARKIRLANLKLLQKPRVLVGIMDAARRDELWNKLIPLVALMTVDHQRKVGELALSADQEVLHSLLESARRDALWPPLINLISLLDGKSQAQMAEFVVAQDAQLVHSLIEAAAETDLWSELLPILDAMEAGHQERIVGAALDEGLPLLELALNTANNYDQWSPILDLLAKLEPALQRRVASAGALPASLRKTFLAQAESHGLGPELAPLLDTLK